MGKARVRIDNLRKSYGDYVAVDNISIEVNEGEIFGLLGPNGAGKTSLLECVEGLRIPDSGTIEICGYNPIKDSAKIKQVLGVQLQSSGLPSSITVKEAIDFFAACHNVKPNQEIVERLGLNEKFRKKYKDLSGGEKRRLVLALATIHNPKVLILDEPTAALDVQARVELHEVMKTLSCNGTSIILATHDMAEAEKLCSRILIMMKGKKIVEGTPKEITAMGSKNSKIFVRTVGNSLQNSDGECVDDYYTFISNMPGEKVSQILNLIESNGDTLVDLRIERESLEEKFVELTAGRRNV
ncbi:ABC transporter ATP-binding protein [Ruminiclostridium herbifermentans]|uniref:ABC transporter ATP-binding protein n=1 Tax=Ruminiclostridium herbifermentans TaxID=2488810 RepID=A0A4U7JHJ1_9FIRM|nr:ABC transporter ATP-binding protein [Ruminiclostridium herbifermentans]QNU66071.1 ABC transporter ATP-binding protein [Ruminiclostridium herbifermentans]